ncbi:MAG: hypothetical protein ACE5J9_02520 [Methanosarcinales archaeon]
MISKKTSFSRLFPNKDAVSELIGTLLLMGIIIGFLALLQVHAVPIWNKEIEYNHIDTVYDDFFKLRADVLTSANSNIPKSSPIDMGVKYPNRMILRNPTAGTSGTLTTQKENITINGSIVGGIIYANNTSIEGNVITTDGNDADVLILYNANNNIIINNIDIPP